MNRQPEPGEIYFELRPYGQQIKVVALDAASGVEVTVFGPKTVSAEELKRLALRKLLRRLEQVAAGAEDERDPTLY